ncbi:beta-glucosidase, partial [Candidatus Hakubella thermalkaliphila]
RYKEDFDLIKFLNNNSYRFSIEWSRIEKEEGKFDQNEIEHYVNMLREMKIRDIEPVLTLHHFTIPQWLYQKGGFENPQFADYFSRFVSKVVPYYKEFTNYWITINEPVIIALMGYIFGDWPPGVKDRKRAFSILRNLVFSHAKAYDIIKEEKKESLISIAHNMTILKPATRNPLHHIASCTLNNWFNMAFLKTLTEGSIYPPIGNKSFHSELKNKLDFIGLNYYTRAFLKFTIKGVAEFKRKNVPRSDFGFEIYPEGLYEILMKLKSFGLPVMITENGIADHEDKYRPDFLKKSLLAVSRAIKKGLDILGYLHWSLMDNFEWVEGYSMKFGLFETNFLTQERKPRESAYIYQKASLINPYTDSFDI